MNIQVSGVLLRFVGYRRNFAVEAATVGAGLHALAQQHTTLKPALFDGSGNVRTTHLLFLNGDQVQAGEIDRPVDTNDTLEILTAIAGG